MRKILALTAALSVAATPALAHVGPGTHDAGPLSHGLTHLLVDMGLTLGLALAAVVVGRMFLRRSAEQRRARK